MKKLNVKKLNHFFLSQSNSVELKDLVRMAVASYTQDDKINAQYLFILTDLGLLLDA